jgi:hypothetical protein
VLLDRATAVQADARDLERHVDEAQVGKVSPPPRLAHADYISKRVQQQIDGYYRPKARENARTLRRFRIGEFVLGLAGTILAALATWASQDAQAAAGPHGTLGEWVAVCTTLSGAIAAHVAANRYDFLVMSYFGTARRLEDLLARWRDRGDDANPTAWSAFVHRCEDAISVENESWLAKWMEKDPDQEGG